MQKHSLTFATIIGLVLAAIALLIVLPLNQGLDLKGGARLTLQVKPTEEITTITPANLADAKQVIENRVNGLGVSEPLIQIVNPDKIVVQLPGVTDPEQAEQVLGETAQLEFRAQKPGSEAQLQIESQLEAIARVELEEVANDPAHTPEQLAAAQEKLRTAHLAVADLFEKSDLTGKYLTNAVAAPLSAGGEQWQVELAFDETGGQLFADLTRSVAGTGRGLGIFLDNVLISAPRVDAQYGTTGITGGRASVSGSFDLESATNLAIQLRGGALPFPVELVENRTVGATLGRDSVNRSLIAGISGLVLVLAFMVAYYRLPGVVADVSLLIYTVLTLACYTLIGVTLTLPGIAGFILSIGMAVDANVLIFERTREELHAGKTLYRSVESGFYRAFSSILDSNVTTLIACGALFWLGSGLVKGFALTLAVGVGVSMFTALTCTRTMLLLVVLGIPGVRQRPELFCPNLPPVAVNPE